MGRRRIAIGAALLLAVLAPACGGTDDGGGDDDAAATTTTTAARSSTTTTSPGTTTTLPPSTFRSSTFEVPFTVDLPAGWTAVERDPEVAQLWVLCDACDHEGESNGEISLDLSLASTAPEEAARRLAAANRLEASAIEPFDSGSLHGVHFTGERPGGFGEVRFEDSGYHTEADAEPIEVVVLSVGGKTITIFVDSHKAKGDAARDFRAAAATILGNLRFG